MLLVRLNELAADGNGLHPAILEALTDMITENALPPVRDPGVQPTTHADADWVQSLYVLAGEPALTIGERELSAQPGSWLQLPRGVRCSVEAAGTEPLRSLEIRARAR